MLRKLLIVLFAAGAIMGFASGFAHIRAHHHDHKRQVIEMCVDAALRARPASDGRDTTAGAQDRDSQVPAPADSSH